MSRRAIEFVQIEDNEDANSVRDRLSFIRGQRVLLIWPEEGTALPRKLDLVLIQREAMRRAIRLALVTHDPEVINNAANLNISTFETIGASERKRWKRGRSKVFTSRFHRPKDEPEPEDLMDVASRVRIDRPSLSMLQRIIIRLAVLIGVIGAISAVIYVVVPGATVNIIPASDIIRDSVQLTVNTDPEFTDVDVENRTLPAITIRLQIEETATIGTTGSQNLGNVQALGTVIFINSRNSGTTIPAGTNVSTSAGTPIMFRTTEEAFLPSGDGEQVEVPIEALAGSAGDVGNVAENMINTVIGPLEESVNVINLAPTHGGQSRTVNAVSATDRERLTAAVRQQIYEHAYTQMLSMVSGTQIVIIETLLIDEDSMRDDWTVFSADIGEITDTLSLTMRVVVEGIVVDTQLGQQIVFARMADQIPRGRVIIPETIEYTHGDVVMVNDTIMFTMSGNVIVIGQIDGGRIQNDLAGKSLAAAMEYLQTLVDIDEDSTPEITLSADWANGMPILPMRINVVVQDDNVVE